MNDHAGVLDFSNVEPGLKNAICDDGAWRKVLVLDLNDPTIVRPDGANAIATYGITGYFGVLAFSTNTNRYVFKKL